MRGETREMETALEIILPVCTAAGKVYGVEEWLIPALAGEIDEAHAVITMAVQVNGKMRGSVEVARDAAEAEVREKALAIPNVVKHMEGKTVRKVIVVNAGL